MSLATTLILLVLAGFLLTAFCSSLLFWYETLNEQGRPFPAPHLSPAACLKVYARSLAGYFLGVFLHPVGWFFSRKVKPPVPGKENSLPPLILIHGINDNSSVWLFLGGRFLREGYSVSTFSYFSLFVPLERILQRLDEHVAGVEAAFPGKKPVFLCHSLGGLLVRRWLLDVRNQRRAGGVVTLATPHGGSKVAALAPGKIAAQIMPGSELVEALKANPLQEELPCVSLVTPTDEAVLPAALLVPPVGWKLVVTNPTSHYGILYNRRVGDLLLEEVRAVAPRI